MSMDDTTRLILDITAQRPPTRWEDWPEPPADWGIEALRAEFRRRLYGEAD